MKAILTVLLTIAALPAPAKNLFEKDLAMSSYWNQIQWSGDERFVLLQDDKDVFHLYDLPAGQFRPVPPGLLRLSREGHLLSSYIPSFPATGTVRTTYRDIDSGESFGPFDGLNSGSAFTSHGTVTRKPVKTGYGSFFLDFRHGRELACGDDGTDTVFSRDLGRLVREKGERELEVLDTATGANLKTIPRSEGRLRHWKLSPEGGLIFNDAGETRLLRLSDLRVFDLGAHYSYYRQARLFLGESKLLVALSMNDPLIVVYDLKAGTSAELAGFDYFEAVGDDRVLLWTAPHHSAKDPILLNLRDSSQTVLRPEMRYASENGRWISGRAQSGGIVIYDRETARYRETPHELFMGIGRTDLALVSLLGEGAARVFRLYDVARDAIVATYPEYPVTSPSGRYVLSKRGTQVRLEDLK